MDAKTILEHLVLPWSEDISLDSMDYEAAITAVNNTYGKGLNPEAFEDCVKGLEAIISNGDLSFEMEGYLQILIKQARI
jgi:hypothetical protein